MSSFFFSSRRRHTRWNCDWSSDVCSSDLTPGIFAPKRRLDRAMVKAAWGGAADADAILVVVDAAEVAARPSGWSGQDTERIVDGLKEARRRAALVLNKVDAMKRDAL